MTISGIKPAWVLDWVGGNMNRARTYETLLFCLNRGGSQRYSETGEIEVRLGWIARKIGVASKASVSRYLAWLSERGFIAIRREAHPRGGFILWIRVLVRPLKRWLERAWNSDGTRLERNTLNSHNSPEYSPAGAPLAPPDQADISQGISPAKAIPPKAPPFRRPGLRGKVADAGDRLAAGKAKRASETGGRKPTPTEAAHAWNAVLREWGDHPFDLNEKNLAHVRRTLEHVQPKTLDDFRSRLEKAVEWWSAHHSTFEKMKGLPAHPWVLNRHRVAAFSTKAPVSVQIPKPETPPAPAPTVAPEPPKWKHTGNSLLGMFTKAKSGYGSDDPGEGEG
jgi:hypothetical protein